MPRDTKPPPPRSGRVERHLKALRSQITGKGRQAALTLGKLGDARAVEPLIKALQDSYPKSRNRIILALQMLGKYKDTLTHS